MSSTLWKKLSSVSWYKWAQWFLFLPNFFQPLPNLKGSCALLQNRTNFCEVWKLTDFSIYAPFEGKCKSSKFNLFLIFDHAMWTKILQFMSAPIITNNKIGWSQSFLMRFLDKPEDAAAKDYILGTLMSIKNRLLPLSWFSDIYSFNILLLFRFSGVFPSVNAAIKRRDQALQVCYLLLKRNDFTC